MDVHVKEEAFDIPTEPLRRNRRNSGSRPPPDSVIELSSSSSSSDSDSDGDLESIVASVAQTVESPSKKRKVNDKGAILPAGFLSPLPPPAPSHNAVLSLPAPDWASSANRNNRSVSFQLKGCKQFWKAGDYDGTPSGGFESSSGEGFYLFIYFFPFRAFFLLLLLIMNLCSEVMIEFVTIFKMCVEIETE
jgi:hypothetical protein